MTKLDQQMVRVLTSLCEDIGTPRALAVKLLACSGEWLQLQQLKCNPNDYEMSETYLRDTIVTDFLRKTQIEGDDSRLEAAAVKTFWECEAQNAKTNQRLSKFLPDRLHFEDPADLRIYSFIGMWRGKFRSLCGDAPDDLTLKFGNGATYTDRLPLITIPDKMSIAPSSTVNAASLKPLYVESAWARSLLERGVAHDLQWVRGNVFFTVPKDAVKHRGCCKEPSMNVAFQLSLGAFWKQRMRLRGLDLYKGQHYHRKMAKYGSLSGRVSTTDLSNASDTVARVLVQLLAEPTWYLLLSSLRSPLTRVNKQWVWLEKFSSMGNGFTFELETMIFYSLILTLCELEGVDPTLVSVYGDDLIAPTEITKSLHAALRYFGFTINERKTFVDGPFRESCGGDFFKGHSVRGHFIEDLPSSPASWMSLANGLRRIAHQQKELSNSRWKWVSRAWHQCLDSIPVHIRSCRGPTHLGDVVIHDDNPKTTTDHNGTEWVRTWVPIPAVLQWNHWHPGVQLASAILGLSPDGVSPRGEIVGYRISKSPLWGLANLDMSS